MGSCDSSFLFPPGAHALAELVEESSRLATDTEACTPHLTSTRADLSSRDRLPPSRPLSSVGIRVLIGVNERTLHTTNALRYAMRDTVKPLVAEALAANGGPHEQAEWWQIVVERSQQH